MTHNTKLHKYEIILYFLGWSGGILYSFYQLYLAGSYFDNYNDKHGDFTPGWSWIERKQDVSDDEWFVWIPLLKQLIPWFTVYLFVAQLAKYIQLNSTIICCWYIFVTTIFLYNYIGANGIIFMFIQPSISCLLISFRSIPVAYYVQLGLLLFVQLTSVLSTIAYEWIQLDDKQYHIITVAIFWVQLRCICCTVDSINNYKHENIEGFIKNFVQITAYCLYLPTFFLGPFFLYSEFIKGINENFKPWYPRKIANFIGNLLRYIFWIFFTEFGLHFLYCNAFRYQSKQVSVLNDWAFYGLGYCMGQYFCNKYIVIYGIGGEISRADDIAAPPPPKCIGRIHLYSDMWKHFDRGLYQFLLRYIYGPIARLDIPLSRIMGSFLSFSFVFLWHGLHKFVFMWSLMNFLGIVVENIAKYIGSTHRYIYWQNRILSPPNVRRFNCFLAAPLLSVSAISNFYFFGGMKIGNQFMFRLYRDSLITIMTLIFILYCCCQVSTEMKRLETQNVKKIAS